MPKVYVSDTETPVYAVYDVKPEGYPTDEIELTDDELTYLRDTEAAAAECDAMIKAKLQGAHGPPNLNKTMIRVAHAELERWDAGLYKSKCPACEGGILLIHRDKDSFLLERRDRCVSCGQQFYYTDAAVNGEAFVERPTERRTTR